MNKKDRNFDDLASKFDANIYGTSKGKLRHELILHYLHEQVLSDSSSNTQKIKILDAGGGTGEMTKSLASLGYALTLNDLSLASLDVAKAKCSKLNGISYHHGSIQSISEQEPYDLVLCHAVMEWVENPEQLLQKLVSLTRSGGYLSITFYNKNAQLFSNMVYGNFQFVLGGMVKRNQVRLTPHSPLAPEAVFDAIKRLPVKIKCKAGIRCFHDYLRDKSVSEQHYAELLALEKRYGTEEPYLSLGKYIQVIMQVH